MSISSIAQPEPTETDGPVGTPDVTDIPPAATVGAIPEPDVEVPVAPLSDLDRVLARIAPVSKTKKRLKLMIYSEPGVGKTTFLGQIKNNLIWDCEGGLATLGGTTLAEGVSTLPFTSFYQGEVLVKALHEDADGLKGIETFSVDTVSELHKKGLAEVLEHNYALNPNNNRYKAETEHHTENNEHLRRLVASMRDLDRNIVLLAHSRTVEPKNEPTKTFPDFSEKLANTLAAMMDIVGYLYLAELDGEIHRVLMVRTNGNVAAKSRINGGMPDQIVDPTWDKIWNYFEAHNANEAQ